MKALQSSAYEGPARCPHCGGGRIVIHNGEYVCATCGTVLGPVLIHQDNHSDEEEERTRNKANHPATASIPLMMRMRALGRLGSRIMANVDDQAFEKVLDAFRRCYVVTENDAETARTIYKALLAKHRGEFLKPEIAFAAIVAALRKKDPNFNIVRARKDVARFGIHVPKPIDIALMLREVGATATATEMALAALKKAVSAIGVEGDVVKRAGEIITAVAGRVPLKPTVIAGATLVLLGLQQSTVAKALGVSEVSLRNGRRKIANLLRRLGRYI